MNQTTNTTAGIDLDGIPAYSCKDITAIFSGKPTLFYVQGDVQELLARRSTSGSNKMWAQEELDRAERSIDLMQSDEASGSDGTAAAGAEGLTALDYRAQGREEALAIILAEDPESPFAECTHSYQIGDTGDYGTDWDEGALRDLLSIGDRKHDAYDRAEAAYWEALGHKEEAECMKRVVKRAPFFKPLHDFLVEKQEWGLLHQLQEASTSGSELASGSDPKLEAALDREYPLPNSPHASVNDRAYNNRSAFERGWYSALAQQTSGSELAVLPPLPGCLGDRLREAISIAYERAEHARSTPRMQKWKDTAADLRAALAQQAGAPADPADEMLDMLGRIHPFAMEKDDRSKAYERLERAYCIQQPWPVPDQACIVWRADLMEMRYDLIHKQACFDSKRAAPAPAAQDEQDAKDASNKTQSAPNSAPTGDEQQSEKVPAANAAVLPPLPPKMGTIYRGNYWTGLPNANPPGAPLADFITMGQATEFGHACYAMGRASADRAAVTSAVDLRLLTALERLLERFMIVYGEPASGATPHEVTIARTAINAARAAAKGTAGQDGAA